LFDTPRVELSASIEASIQWFAANQSTGDGKISRAVELAAAQLEVIRMNRKPRLATV
jgi:hypothetical protein